MGKNIQRYTLGFSKIETTNYDERFQQRGFFVEKNCPNDVVGSILQKG